MPEVNPNFAREWVEFADPSNPEDLFKCDLTWLTSNWQCIYGDGCCGIDEGKPDSGCCSDGAYYTDKEDEARTLKAAQRLTPDMWQFYHEARPKRKGGTLNISEVGHAQMRARTCLLCQLCAGCELAALFSAMLVSSASKSRPQRGNLERTNTAHGSHVLQ